MREATKKALKEMMEAIKETDSLCHFEEVNANKPIYYYDDKTLDALAEAYEKEKQARIKYHALFLEDQSWTKEQIDKWLKRAGLK